MERTETFVQGIEREANDLWKLSQKTYDSAKKQQLVTLTKAKVVEVQKYIEEQEGKWL